MQSLRRIPAGAQVRVLFLNRSCAASTSNTDALTLRLNAISRLNSGNFLRFDDRNLVRTDFLCFQRRLQSTVQNSEGKKPETSSTNSFLKKLQEETPPTIFLTDLLSFEKFCDKQFKGVDKKIFRISEMKKIKGDLRSAYFWYIVMYIIFFTCVYEAYGIWSDECELKSKVEKKYATYLSSESVPFDDCIEKLLKSGKVKQIIHLMWFGKVVAVLSHGAIVDGVTINQSGAVLDDVTAGEDYVVLNLENSPFVVRYLLFFLQVRRMEYQLGIESSNTVHHLKKEGLSQLSFRWALLGIFVLAGSVLELLGRRKIVTARSMIRGKLTV